MTTSALANASWYVAPSAAQPGSSGTSAMKAWSSLLQYKTISYRTLSSIGSLTVRPVRRLFVRNLASGFHRVSSQTVGKDHTADLLDLVWFRLASARLQVQDFRHIVAGEDVVASSDTLVEAEMA
jgi:hypothetical protein